MKALTEALIKPDMVRPGAAIIAIGCFALLAAMRAPLAIADSSSSQIISDAQCLVVGARLSASSDQRGRLSGQMLLIYYLGRLDGRASTANLETLIDEEAARMTLSDFKSAAQRCGTEFSARGAELAQIGRSLSKLGK